MGNTLLVDVTDIAGNVAQKRCGLRLIRLCESQTGVLDPTMILVMILMIILRD